MYPTKLGVWKTHITKRRWPLIAQDKTNANTNKLYTLKNDFQNRFGIENNLFAQVLAQSFCVFWVRR